MKKYFLTLILTLSFGLEASVEKASFYYKKSRGIADYPDIARELIEVGLYFTAIPFIKEYLIKTNVSRKKSIDKIIDDVITEVGVKQFEVLPISVLKKSNAPTIRYILAKKLFRTKNYSDALNLINSGIPEDHALTPFVYMLRASIYTITDRHRTALPFYKECIDASETQLRKAKSDTAKRQLTINRDLCLVGIPRTQFAAKDNKAANSSYLDLPKESPIWPEILFEEAWNSFYLRDYNRTLGKLVTYRSPIFSYMFNPEIETLRALTYMELCLWADTKKVVDDFYKDYRPISQKIGALLSKNSKNYKYYYLLAKDVKNKSLLAKDDVSRLVKSITRDPIYQELHASFYKGSAELSSVRSIGNSQFRSVLAKGLREALILQRNLIGAYVRKGLDNYKYSIDKTFEGMSYIRLEVLSRRKEELYSPKPKNDRERGDVNYLQRNDKQYFWTFNGEFWADELGDYVFALKSECR